MKVLTVIDYLSVGGPANVAVRTSSALLNAGHQVTMVVLYKEIAISIPPDITLCALKLKKTKYYRLRYTRFLHDYIRKIEGAEPFDLILVHLSHSIRLMRQYQHPYIYNYLHNTLSKETADTSSYIKGQFKLFKLRRYHKGLNLIAVSKGVELDARNVVKIRSKSIRTIYNPVDADKIRKLSLENIHPDLKGERYIIHIGRFVSQKRHDRLIRAYHKSNISAKLLLMGEGPLEQDARDQVRRLGIEHKVIFFGLTPNPYPLLSTAMLLVLSSDYEGLPTVLVEALALRVPVISTDCPHGPKEIFDNYIHENLIPLSDDDRLAEQISRVCQSPDKFRPDENSYYSFLPSVIAQQYESLIDKS